MAEQEEMTDLNNYFSIFFSRLASGLSPVLTMLAWFEAPLNETASDKLYSFWGPVMLSLLLLLGARVIGDSRIDVNPSNMLWIRNPIFTHRLVLSEIDSIGNSFGIVSLLVNGRRIRPVALLQSTTNDMIGGSAELYALRKHVESSREVPRVHESQREMSMIRSSYSPPSKWWLGLVVLNVAPLIALAFRLFG